MRAVRLRTVLIVARREAAAAWEDRLPALAASATAALLLVAALGAWQHHRAEAAQRLRYQEMVRSQWLEQPDRHPHRVAHYGYLVFRERSPLAVFDPGVDAFAGTALFLEAHRRNRANAQEAAHATALVRFGHLTPVSVLLLFLPLLVVAAGFSSVSRERERGTLPLVLAQGATPGEFLAGKLAGVAMLACVATAPLLLAAPSLAGGSLPGHRVALLAGIHMIYLAGWILLTVLVSARSAGSRGSLAVLLAAWILVSVVAPRASSAVATAAHPTPTRAEFDARVERALREVGDSHNPDDPFFATLRDAYLTEYGVASVADLPVNWGGVVSRAGEEITTRVHDEAHASLSAAFQRQDRVIAWSGLAAPYLAARDLSMAAAGTDPATVERFRSDAEAYRFELIQRLNDLHIHEIRYENDRAQRVGRESWAEVPVVRTSPPDAREVLADEPARLAALGLWLLAPLMGLAASRSRLAHSSGAGGTE